MRRAAVLVFLVAAACSKGKTVSGPPPSASTTMQLSSSAFAGNGTIPREFTCDGRDIAPPLHWTGVPASAKSLALLVEDPDAPGGTFVHWAAFAIDPSATSPADGTQGKNSFGSLGWKGPCPPKGSSPHHYVFTIYALRVPLALTEGASASDVRKKIATSHPLAQGRLVGRYGR
jgi:Raf kinase inhibitor-like YbhB/YbcL family protein